MKKTAGKITIYKSSDKIRVCGFTGKNVRLKEERQLPKMRTFHLYLDESGDFNDTRPDRPYPDDLYLVGGMLVDPDIVTNEMLRKMFPFKVHCSTNGFRNDYLTHMESLVNQGQRIIIFENTERLKIISPDRTYINILSEGLLKLFQDLKNEYSESVQIKVIIAQRNAALKEYASRLEEQLILGFGRAKINGCKYELELSDARVDRRLFIADILCYTYLTTHRVKNKFTPEQQNRAEQLFEKAQIYSIFEDATVSYIKKLLLDNHLGEAICQICALPHLKTLVKQRDIILRRLPKLYPMEREQVLGQISIQLTNCEHQWRFPEGIALANHFKQYFLEPMAKNEELKAEAAYWSFDTDFHILTMYDHLGNTFMSQTYITKCRENIAAVTNSWEHLDYYFSFRIRELNSLMDQFRFEEVIQKSDDFIKMFQDTRDYFNALFSKSEIDIDVKSVLLGKTQGIRLQAMINMVSRKPELFEEAVKASDKAISEFTNTSDIIRQLNYRSMLMVVMNKPDEALDCLYRIAGLLDKNEPGLDTIVRTAYRDPNNPDVYLLLYYSNVAILLLETNHPKAEEVCKILFENPTFEENNKFTKKTDYPRNRIFWNTAKYYRLHEDFYTADKYYEKALVASSENKDQATVVSYCVAISAERLLSSQQNRNSKTKKLFAKKWEEANRILQANNIPESIQNWFDVNHPDAEKQATSAWK
ncbi:MAG: hypothetical protein IJ088_01040 [Clostridia bacterium]|nr:hypothetical protein [Clostridia bacterium]